MKPFLGRLARWIKFALLSIASLLIGVWSSIAIWYRCPAGEPVRGLLAGATLILALIAVASLATSRRWLALGVYAGCFVLFLAWWTTIMPTNDRNWAPDVGRTATATLEGDRLVVSNVRNFNWRSDTVCSLAPSPSSSRGTWRSPISWRTRREVSSRCSTAGNWRSSIASSSSISGWPVAASGASIDCARQHPPYRRAGPE